jgi:hypothetical protein
VYGYPLEIHTDHKPLTTMFKDKQVEGKMARWALKVATYNAEIVYKQGK